uniref:DUF155 domain-containing protein n=1 Tax=Globisporangium ultimum (strain ATCC 200006 / CBS 805.95 / DAOM BR144) TaxID=431595 RepID=K3X7Y1_GLOUD
MADAQQQNERSPLLPRQPPLAPSGSARGNKAAEPHNTSFLGAGQTIRHRKKSRSQLRTADEEGVRSGADQDNDYSADTDDNDEDDEDPLSDVDGIAHGQRAEAGDSIFPPEKPAFHYDGGGSGGGVLPLGIAKRKPHWSGLRSKLASISSAKGPIGQEIAPRMSGRRSRYRPSTFRDDSDYYNEAVAMKKLREEPPTDVPKARVAAYCTCDQIALFKLLKWLDRATKEVPVESIQAGSLATRFHLTGWKNKMYMGVIHSTFRPPQSKDASAHDMHKLPPQKDAFYFATGCCVFWGLTREEEALHVQALEPFSTGPVAQIEAEDMLFFYGDASRIASDEISLKSDAVTEKLAISFAMSQSAKLDVFEERVEDRIRNTKHIPSNLATTGSIQYTKTDISKLIGQLFIELADVNLHSDILDEPDFFWEDDEYEPLYKRMVKYLDVNNRVKILNKRLDILRELVEVLNQELTRQHGTKLEWIIIWLLVAEIFLAVVWNILVKDLLGYFRH